MKVLRFTSGRRAALLANAALMGLGWIIPCKASTTDESEPGGRTVPVHLYAPARAEELRLPREHPLETKPSSSPPRSTRRPGSSERRGPNTAVEEWCALLAQLARAATDGDRVATLLFDCIWFGAVASPILIGFVWLLVKLGRMAGAWIGSLLKAAFSNFHLPRPPLKIATGRALLWGTLLIPTTVQCEQIRGMMLASEVSHHLTPGQDSAEPDLLGAKAPPARHLEASFQPRRHEDDFCEGWDDSGSEPRISVALGAPPNTLAKAVVPAAWVRLVELVVSEDSVNYLDLEHQEITGVETNFDIVGKAPTITQSGDDGYGYDATVLLRNKMTHAVLCRLHVMVLPSRQIPFDVIYISTVLVATSEVPAEAPAAKRIEGWLEKAFGRQANVHFVLKQSRVCNTATGCFDASGNLDWSGYKGRSTIPSWEGLTEIGWHLDHDPGVYRIFIVKHITGLDVIGATPWGLGYSFLNFDANPEAFAREAGRVLHLPRVHEGGEPPLADPGPWPKDMAPGSRGLMGQPKPGEETLWLRWQDWVEGNCRAALPLFTRE